MLVADFWMIPETIYSEYFFLTMGEREACKQKNLIKIVKKREEYCQYSETVAYFSLCQIITVTANQRVKCSHIFFLYLQWRSDCLVKSRSQYF